MVTGYICCKFEEGSANLKALGVVLSKQCTPDFMPEFVIQDTSRCMDGRGVKVKLTEKIISRLTTYGMLSIPPIDFEVPNAMASTTIALILPGGCQDSTKRYLLSGFPRTLMQEIPCRPSTSTNRDRRSYHQPRAVRFERHQTYDRPSEISATPSRSSQTRPPLPARPKSSTQPYLYATPSRMDSAVELPYHSRVPQPPQQYSTQYARPQNVPLYQAFSYERAAPTQLVERAARKVQFEDQRKLQKSRGEKRLVKKRGSGKVSVEAR